MRESFTCPGLPSTSPARASQTRLGRSGARAPMLDHLGETEPAKAVIAPI
jgi:hypothetical protein